jgi:hypothetical protein
MRSQYTFLNSLSYPLQRSESHALQKLRSSATSALLCTMIATCVARECKCQRFLIRLHEVMLESDRHSEHDSTKAGAATLPSHIRSMQLDIQFTSNITSSPRFKSTNGSAGWNK